MTWRRRLRDTALRVAGRRLRVRIENHRPALPRTASGRRDDAGPVSWDRRPRQGDVGDCWVMAPLLALWEADPASVRRLVSCGRDGVWEVRLHRGRRAVTVRTDRSMPVAADGRWVGARESGAEPGWVGLVEKAAALEVAGSYRLLSRGIASRGIVLLTGARTRTYLRLPSAQRLDQWVRAGHVVVASTWPRAPWRPRAGEGALEPLHVFAVVGADPASGDVRLRNPWSPDDVVTVDHSTFVRRFVSVERTVGPVVGRPRGAS